MTDKHQEYFVGVIEQMMLSASRISPERDLRTLLRKASNEQPIGDSHLVDEAETILATGFPPCYDEDVKLIHEALTHWRDASRFMTKSDAKATEYVWMRWAYELDQLNKRIEDRLAECRLHAPNLTADDFGVY